MPPDTQIPKNCPAWLAQWIGQSDQRLCNIEKTLVRLVKRSVPKDNPTSKENQVTFKWLIEKLLVPIMFVLAGYLVAGGA